MKKLISLLLCFAVLLSLAPSAIATEQTDGNFRYIVEENGEATLTGVLASEGEIVIPETLAGHSVTRLASGAIYELSAKRIIVPKTVRYFEKDSIRNCLSTSVYILAEDAVYEEAAVLCIDRVYAYRCATSYAGIVITKFCPLEEYPPEPWTLEERTEGNMVYAVRDGEAIVLRASSRANHVVVPQSLGGYPVTRIAPYAFGGKLIDSLTLCEGLKSIGSHAVNYPKLTESVKLPSTLEYIGDYAFNETHTTGDLPSAKYIGSFAFYRSGRTQISFGEHLEYVGSCAFNSNSIPELTIPASTKHIGRHAFAGAQIVTVLSKDVVLDGGVFAGAEKIIGYFDSTAMYAAISDGICFVDIETGESLPAAYVTEKNGLEYYVYYDHAEVINVCDKTVTYEIYSIDEEVDGRPVTHINGTSLQYLRAKAIILPDTVTTIAFDAFYSNGTVQEIWMSANIETLSEYAFYGCTSLRLIFWPDNAHELTLHTEYTNNEDPLFPGCDGAFFVTLPGSEVQKFAEKEGYRVLPLTQDIAYLTDGLGVYSTDGEEATVLAMFQEVYESEPHTYTIPDTIFGIPVTTVSGDMHWSHSVRKLYLGYYVKTVEDGALANCELRELIASKNVEALPYPLFAEGVKGAVYGYGDTYVERFCREHKYTFYQIDSMPFSDVKKSDWYFDSVLFCHMTGLMNGTSAISFAPNATTTRAMLAQVLYNMAGAPSNSWEYGFKDVKQTDWFYTAVNWCRRYNLAFGTSEYIFSPNLNVTREQVATFLYRYAQACHIPVTSDGDLGKFDDVKRVSSYAMEAMRWAVANGIINGQTPTTLNPQGYATRAEIATMLMRFVLYAE